jgi:REP element-mobilizing transposase RayT
LYYHVVWTTRHRQPLITHDIARVLYPFIENRAKRCGSYVHSIGGIEDHIHLAISIPPSSTVSDIVGRLKEGSRHFLNKELGITSGFSWQHGFGVFSFSESDLPAVVGYVLGQQAHHRSNETDRDFEMTGDDVEETVQRHRSIIR